MTSDDYERARRMLMRRDPTLGAIITRIGRCRLGERPDVPVFTFMTGSIISQQLSTKAADTIRQRVIDLFPADQGLSPAGLLDVADEALRAAGLSRQKVAYVRDLASKVESGALPIDALAAMEDEAVVEVLTQVKGIGRWSAQMFLMFRLRRPDVLPTGDLGIVRAVERAYRLRKALTPARLTKIAEPWRPYRSVACWYLWQSLDNEPK